MKTVKNDLEGLDTKANVQMIQTKSVAEQFTDMERKLRVQGLNLMSLAKEFKTLDKRIGVQSQVTRFIFFFTKLALYSGDERFRI